MLGAIEAAEDRARFGAVTHDVMVPIAAVLGIYAGGQATDWKPMPSLIVIVP